MKTPPDDLDELPEALVEALRGADEQLPMITSRVDRAVLRSARRQFSGRRTDRRWAAVAAALAVAVLVSPMLNRNDQAPAPGPVRPDISDVLKLARERAGQPGAQAEIDALAARVVSLAPPGDHS